MDVTKQGNGGGALTLEPLHTKLNRLTEKAKRRPDYQFRTLAHLIDEELLTRSFRELRKDAAAGVDQVTARDYEMGVRRNVADLHRRLRDRRYHAQPMRRVYIEKEDGKRRPLSIPALEDKIVQKATVEVLSRIYEEDFLPCSYGYRPGRNAHQAVQAVQRRIIFDGVNYVLEADIQDYFGSVVRQKLEEMLQKRVVDKDVLRLIGKWLRAGVIEDGKLFPTDGVPQGSVISPLLANVYLHEVLDLWVEREVKPRMKGKVTLVRYADDFVLLFRHREDAERVQQVLPKRFERFGLRLHPDKTRLFKFSRFERERGRQEGRKANTFNFLGFTFYATKDRKGGATVQSKTMSKRLRRSLKAVAEWCRTHRHEYVYSQRRHLAAVLQGHYQYYGIRANFRSLYQFYRGVRYLWQKWLSRRSQKARLSWEKFHQILKRYPLPRPWITQRRGPAQLHLFRSSYA